MKKKIEKAIAKESIKIAKKELTEQIVSALRLVTVNFTKNLKKTDKLITKEAKRLAKKLAKGVVSKPVIEIVESIAPPKEIKKVAIKKEKTTA